MLNFFKKTLAQLVITTHKKEVYILNLKEKYIQIGLMKDLPLKGKKYVILNQGDLLVADTPATRTINKKHATLTWKEGRYVLRDLSRSGTYLRRARAFPKIEIPLQDGEIMELGDNCPFRLEIKY